MRYNYKRQEAKRKATEKRDRSAYLSCVRAAAKNIAKLLPTMKSTQRWQEDRKNIVRKALDILAGEVASAKVTK